MMNQLNKADLFRALEGIPTQEQIEAMAEKSKAQMEDLIDGKKKAEARAEYWRGAAKGIAILNHEETREQLAAARNAERAAMLAAVASNRTENALKERRKERLSYAGLVLSFELVEKKRNLLDGDEIAARGEALKEGKEKGWLPQNMTPNQFREMHSQWVSWRRPKVNEFEKMWKAKKRAEKPATKRKPKKKG